MGVPGCCLHLNTKQLHEHHCLGLCEPVVSTRRIMTGDARAVRPRQIGELPNSRLVLDFVSLSVPHSIHQLISQTRCSLTCLSVLTTTSCCLQGKSHGSELLWAARAPGLETKGFVCDHTRLTKCLYGHFLVFHLISHASRT